MAPRSIPTVTADITVDAHPNTLYSLITDLPTLAELAEETTAMRWTKGDSVRPGAVFKGTNRNGNRSWTTTCTVTEAEPGRVFAWDVRSGIIPISHWRYEFTPGENNCRVTESTWDRRPGWFRGIGARATGVPDRDSANADHIRMTLQRLKARAEA
jgi:hypothetical protein